MKKIFICSTLIIVIFICMISSSCYKKENSKSNNKHDIQILLKAHDANNDSNVIASNVSDNNDYELLNDYEDNSNSKKEKSVDFISEIPKETNNPYNINNNNANENLNITNNDVALLAKLIESEAGNQTYLGKLAVGSVVLNRCKINGESLSSVVYASKQFDGIGTQSFSGAPSNDSIKAATEILSGQNVIPNAYYYANLNLCSPDFANKDKFIERIGDHWFFKK